jgi:CHAT domain-containing protein
MATSVAASAVLWLRLQESARRHRPADGGALFLADPGLPGGGGDPGSRRLLRSSVSPGPLPHAREEAQLALQALDRPGEVLLGAAASEAALKARDLSGLHVLHLAAHAVVDDGEPARSAVLLAPGGEGEDGLLQPREILDMDLDGALVTLSACRSGGGPALDGEGVLGLARAFFLARAEAVVGSLWPVRDDETARLMVAFYRRLAGGASIEAALAGAKRQQRAAGAPAAAWAGFVVFGHAATPLPPPRSGRPWGRAPAALTLLSAGLLALAGGSMLRRRGRRPGTASREK